MRRSRRERLALGLLLLALAAMLVGARVRSHRDVDTREREQLAHQVAGLGHVLGVQLASVREAMHGLRASLGPVAEPSAPARERFRTLAAARLGVDELQWLDVDGRVVASSRGDAPVGRDRSDRSYFREARAAADRGRLVVSEPLRVAADASSVALALPLAGADGAFAGVVAATLDPAYFSTVLAPALYAVDMRAAVVDGNGVVLACLQADGACQGGTLDRPGSLFRRFRDSGRAALVVEGPVLGSGEIRLAAFGLLQPSALAMDRPLVLSVTRPVAAVFETWEQNTVAWAAIYVAFAAVACTVLLPLQRRRAAIERPDAPAAPRHDSGDPRLELAVDVAVEVADLALWDLHVPTRRVRVNPRWHAMLGHAPESDGAAEAEWEAQIHPDDRAGVLQARDDHLAGRAPGFDVRYRLRHARGGWRWIVDRGRVVERDAGGRAIRMVGTNFDVTPLIEAEEALRRSEQDLASTLQSIGEGVIATDTAGTVTRLNAAAETLTGWTAAEALGQPLARVLRTVDAGTRRPRADPVGRVLAGGARVDLGDTALLVARDGSEHPVSESAAPIRDAAGRIAGAVLVFSDVSRLRAAVVALQRSEQQLLTLTAALPGPVARFDREGRYLFTNATCERWFGDPPSRRLGRDWHDVFPPAVVAVLDPHLQRALEGVAATFDTALPTLAGERQAMVSVVPDRDADGTVQGFIVALTDVTDRHRAEAALRQGEERARSLLDALRSGVVVHALDWTIVDANASACRILGHEREALIGLRSDDAVWCFFREDGTEIPLAQSPVTQVRAGGVPVDDWTIGVRRRGSAERVAWLFCSAFAVRGLDGAVQQIVVTFVDVTEHKLARERLLHSQEQLRMASRLARLGGWRFNVASGRIAIAPELVALIGARPDAVEDEGFAAAMSAADRDRWAARLRQAVADGLPIDDEFVAVGPQGRRVHWRLLGEAVRDASGTLTDVQGALQDVTDARRAEEQLRLLEAAVAGLNDMVVITEVGSLDEPGPRMVFVNDAFERLTGYDRAAAIGRSPRMLQGPDTPGPELDRLREALRAQRPVHVELVNYRRDGGRYWVGISMVPLVDRNGRATHFVAVQRDITESKQAAAAVEAAQRELAATLGAVPDLLFDIDLDGRIHQYHAPPTGRHPVDAADIVGRRVTDVFPDDASTVVMAALAEAHAQGHSAGRQYEVASRSERHSFELSVSCKPVPAGERPRFILLARDVSERSHHEAQRRMLERQLREAQKMESIGTLAGGIAHDFNNILAAILGNLALARDELPADHAAQSTLGQIGKASVRARSLVQQILTFSRRQPNPLRPRALRPIVEETLGLLRATLPAGVRLESRLPDAELVVSADATQLQQVLMNLCTNAWQALPENRGRIEIGLEALDAGVRIADLGSDGPWAHLWVSDDGAGMDAITRERIFDPFFTTKPVGRGTGLGLSVVHGIARSHHGTVAVETALGQGSTFHLYLPLAGHADVGVGEGETGHAPLAPSVTHPTRHGGAHLLYVDDDEVMVMMVQRLLQRDGFRVSACSSAAQALVAATRPDSDFDLVVSDFNMPEMSGLDLAENLARLRPGLPMIISSGYLTDELRDGARALGVRGLLQKERTLEELADLVRRVLAGATVV